ncbi:hypothetical protein LguiB_021613 [Lonicera macranthoides]
MRVEVTRVLIRSHKVKACNEGVADLGGGECQTLMHEKPNTKRQGDAVLCTVLMGSLIYTGT